MVRYGVDWEEYVVAPAGTAGQLAIYCDGVRIASVIDEKRCYDLVDRAMLRVAPSDDNLEAHLDAETDVVRVLRKLPRVPTCVAAGGLAPSNRATTIAIVDVETTGLDPDHDKIIELSILLVALDEDDIVIGTMGQGQWFEDPGADIDPAITRLTGISTRDVKDHKIDDAAVAALMAEVDLIVAHNAGFDRGFWDKRFPALADYCWVCSVADVDWKAKGAPSNALLALAWARGFHFEAHRATSDTEALAALLATSVGEEDGPPSAELMKNARARRHYVYAWGAAFKVKDKLKLRGYDWLPGPKVWRCSTTDPDAERAWLAETAAVIDAETSPIKFSDRFRRAAP